MSDIKHGGVRPGAGRPATDGERMHVKLPTWAAALARALGDGNLSRGIVSALERHRVGDKKPPE